MGAMQGVVNIMLAVCPFHVMCDSYDLGGVTENMHQSTLNSTIFIYDAFEDGVGLTAKAYNLFEDIIKMAHDLICECDCSDGCPGCIYSSQNQSDNKYLNKKATKIILEDLYEIIVDNNNLNFSKKNRC